MIRPSTRPREITIDLPPHLVESLGCGAEVLAKYLTDLAEEGVSDPASHPPPLPVLCRICERQVTPWWFEKHSELCLQEHRAELEVQMAHEALTDHRNAIVKVLDALEARKSRSMTTDPSPSPAIQPEYKGFPIGPSSNPSSGSTSGRVSPATPPRSRESSSAGLSASSLGHVRARSFAVRRPLSRIVELILDLCDTAIEINTPMIKDSKHNAEGHFRTQSPGSESRISQVLSWQIPSASTLESEQGLASLSADTDGLARAKVESVLRYRRIIEYSERIRVEYHILVQDCIEAAVAKAADIAAGNISSSSEDEKEEEDVETPAPTNITSFPEGSYDGPSAMATALRNTSNPALVDTQFDRRQSSAAVSSRSSSPIECPTPRSHSFAAGILGRSQSTKRQSLYGGSDAGESDSSMQSSIFSGARRTESPGSERALGRSMSSRERKRKSLKLPGIPSPQRGQSPARIVQPASPLRLTKPRIPSGQEITTAISPINSPILSSSELSGSALLAHHHRRQSSAASSAEMKPPTSPRLNSISHPQTRAVAPSIKDFEIIKPISKGAFGCVYLSKKKSTGDYYAIKVLKKADMIAKNQVTNVKAERAIMMWQGESDFVAKLYYTFSSKDYLYLVMEYLNGGDCASLVKVLGGLSEDWAKKYLAEVVLGVEHLHSRGIVHRDLKPDNLLIDQKGHLKLTDFGLSRMGLIGRQKRILKSPQESAPDLLKAGPFTHSHSLSSSRSASFDFQGGHSPSTTPIMTPDLAGGLGQPSYFNLSRESTFGRDHHSRRQSGYRSDSGNSDTFSAMFKSFTLNEESNRGPPIEEESLNEGIESPDPYALHPTTSHTSAAPHNTPPQNGMFPPPMALFDPDDHNRRFVGTPDYLAPETINGLGQDEMSDWWSLGCILFEFVYGYPPFHADSPDEVFGNILAQRIHWPPEDEDMISDEAKDLMKQLMTINPKERLGANMLEKFSSGGEEIRKHAWFNDLNWGSLLEDAPQFVPAPEHPEDTEYFDARGATLQAFAEELEDQASSPNLTPGADYTDRPHDALSRVRNQVNSLKRGLMPLHIPAHVRDSRSRRLSEPVANDDFGNFAFKNLPVLEKANKDVIQKLRAEAMQGQAKTSGSVSAGNSPAPSLESSPLLPSPLKRTLSAHKSSNYPVSPSVLSHTNPSPQRASPATSPLLVSFSTGPNHERRKTSSNSSSLSHQSGNSLQPGSFFDVPRLPTNMSIGSAASATSSPAKTARTLVASPDKGLMPQRTPSVPTSRARSQTVGSQEGDNSLPKPFGHHKRRSQVFDVSPSSSDNEDPRAKALLRVQRRRQSSRRLSQFSLNEGPMFRPLDVLICEDHPVSRLVMERLLEKLKCRTITVVNGQEAVRYATSEVQFDIIMMEVKLPQINGPDVARMIRGTKNANAQTPIIAVTGYLKELPKAHHFNALVEKPPTIEKLSDVMTNLCNWKPPPADWEPHPSHPLPSGLRQEFQHAESSPSSQSSGPFPRMPGSSYHSSSRNDSVTSSWLGDAESTTTDGGVGPVIVSQQGDDWSSDGLGIGMLKDVEGHSKVPFVHPGLPHLLHMNSAPPDVDLRAPRKQRSTEAMRAKRENMEKNRHECAESGDDEDEEMGDFQIQSHAHASGGSTDQHYQHLQQEYQPPLLPQQRNISPDARTKSQNRNSKLGTEMMRTNSRGSVIMGGSEDTTPIRDVDNSTLMAAIPAPTAEQVQAEDKFPLSPKSKPVTPVIGTVPNIDTGADTQSCNYTSEPVLPQMDEQRGKEGQKHQTITPPEIFPKEVGGGVRVFDMDADANIDVTPRPLSASGIGRERDIDATPRPTPLSSQSLATELSPTPSKGI